MENCLVKWELIFFKFNCEKLLKNIHLILGKAKLPSNFSNVQLFPAVDMYFLEESIRANFKKDEWKFNEFKLVLE